VLRPVGDAAVFSSQRGIDANRGITYEITGPFRTGAPAPVVPEVPLTVALPLSAAVVAAGVMGAKHFVEQRRGAPDVT
jgi:hypothetical protein